MNIKEIINEACRRLKQPSIVDINGSDNQSREFLGYANQMARDIHSFFDWRQVKKDYNFVTTSPIKNNYDLPEDFSKILVYYIYDINRNNYLPNRDDDKTLEMQASGTFNQDNIGWRLIGEEIVFDNDIGEGRNLRFTYKKNTFAKDTTGTETVYTDYFTNNDNTFLLDDEALILGIVYLRNKTYITEDVMLRKEDYYSKLNLLTVENKGLRKFNMLDGSSNSKTSPTSFQPYGGK